MNVSDDICVAYSTQDDCAILTLDRGRLNSIGASLRRQLTETVRRALDDAKIKAIVITGAGGNFSAGADITEFADQKSHRAGPDYLEIIEDSSKPVAAAIEGIAFGGGLELALCCHYRVADPCAQLALPEVKIGLIPGGGGTQRLPRLIGVERAVTMICSGEPISGQVGTEWGLVDQVASSDLVNAAIQLLRTKLAAGQTTVRVRDRNTLVERSGKNEGLLEGARRQFGAGNRTGEGPLRAIDAIANCMNMSFEAALRSERTLFASLVSSSESKALRHIFFAERQTRKIPDLPPDKPVRPIRRAGVIGAGTMGGGIAMCLASIDLPVVLVEQSREALDRCLSIIGESYEKSTLRGRMTEADAAARIALITPSQSLEDAAECDLVIEAIIEDMDAKKILFRELSTIVRDTGILATNTSTLDVDAIAAVTGRAQDVIGLHFFSPAHVMPLLEVVRGKDTAADVIATSMNLAQRIAKVPVLVRVCDGFVGNRMLAAYRSQASALLLEGVLPLQVDKALVDFGFAMGPFTMSDLAGLDVSWRIRRRRGQQDPIADRLCELGRFGQKTGAGYYRYENGERTPHEDPFVTQLIEDAAAQNSIVRKRTSDAEIVSRCVHALVNEGAKILADGIALRASDIDVVYVNGYGFPRVRGGPMHWADTVGLQSVLAKIVGYAERFPEQPIWSPAPLIESLVKEGWTFAGYDAPSRPATT